MKTKKQKHPQPQQNEGPRDIILRKPLPEPKGDGVKSCLFCGGCLWEIRGRYKCGDCNEYQDRPFSEVFGECQG